MTSSTSASKPQPLDSNAFDRETALTGSPDGQQGHWLGHIDPNWNIGDNPNGGYLAAVALRSLLELTPTQSDPLSVTTHYLRPGTSEMDCQVQAEIIRPGRTLSTVRAELHQNGKQRLSMIASMGNLSDSAEPGLRVPAPAIPSPENCIARTGESQGIDPKILNRLEIRLDPAHASAGGGEAIVSGWVRFRDGREPDTHACLLFADAFPPSIFNKLGAVGWVPTIELTVHVRRRPAPGWMQARFQTTDLTAGRMIEDGMLWDSQGNLIAQSRQLALLLG